MTLYISQEVMQVIQVEREKFHRRQICLTPVWVEGQAPQVWAMTDAGNSSEPIAELKSTEMSIWVLQRCLAELDQQLIVRGRRGFAIGPLTDSMLSQAIAFVEAT